VVQWNPERERPPARYAPPYATGFSRIDDVQFARFRRGDTTLNVAAFDLTADSVLGDHPADTRLAVAQDPSTPIVVAPVSALGRSGALTLRSLWRPAVLSLEAVGVDTPGSPADELLLHQIREDCRRFCPISCCLFRGICCRSTSRVH